MGMSGSGEPNKTDHRTERTLSALWEALLALIEEAGYEAVSVRDIADRAKINRATFYRYYEDKDDLFRQGCVAIFDSIVDEARIEEIEDPGRALEQLPKIISGVFSTLEKRREPIRILTGPKSNPAFRDIFTDKIEAIVLDKRLRLWDSALGLFEEPILTEAYVCMISATIVKLILWWLAYPERIPAAKIASIYMTLIMGGMKELLANRIPLHPEPSGAAT
jgi:AcrR family transcriptional regulator